MAVIWVRVRVNGPIWLRYLTDIAYITRVSYIMSLKAFIHAKQHFKEWAVPHPRVRKALHLVRLRHRQILKRRTPYCIYESDTALHSQDCDIELYYAYHTALHSQRTSICFSWNIDPTEAETVVRQSENRPNETTVSVCCCIRSVPVAPPVTTAWLS